MVTVQAKRGNSNSNIITVLPRSWDLYSRIPPRSN